MNTELDARIKERNRRVLDLVHERTPDINAFIQATGAARDKSGKGIVCPKCGSGSGKNGTGPTMCTGKRGYVFCAKCEEHKPMDAVDVIQAQTGCTWTDALRTAAERLGIPWEDVELERHGTRTNGTTSTYRREEPRQTSPAPTQSAMQDKPKQDYSEYLKRAQAALTDDSEGAQYLVSRGFDLDTARALGIGYDAEHDEWYKPGGEWVNKRVPRIIIPTDTGGYVGRYADASIPDDIDRVRNAKGCDVTPSWTTYLEGTDPVYIVEGWGDALAIASAGGYAVSLNSTSNADLLLTRITSLLEQGKNIPPLILQLDPDDAGRKAQAKLTVWLDERGLRHIDGTICLPNPDSPDELLDPADSRLADSGTFYDRTIADYRRAKMSAREEYERELQDRFAHLYAYKLYTGTPRIPTGLEPIDRQLGGGLFAGLFIIGGRTGSGKSTLALQLADGIAAQGRHVLYIALEMSTLELYAKSLARIAYDMALDRGITNPPSYSDVLEGKLRELTWGSEPASQYTNTIAPYMDIYEAIGHTPAETVIEKAREIRKKSGTSPVVIVDYLQIMGADDPHLSDKQATDANVLGLKQLSRDLDTPVIALSSLNRAGYGDDAEPGKPPTQVVTEASFKESGACEYGCDCLIGLERTDPWGDQSPKRNIQIKLLKNRRGMIRPAEGFTFWGGSSVFNPYAGAVRKNPQPEQSEVTCIKKYKGNRAKTSKGKRADRYGEY